MDRVSLIYNPTAGGLQRDPSKIESLIAALHKAGIAISSYATTCAGHAMELARQAVEKGAEVVIVCGGDGTINEVAQSLVKTDTSLAVWPCGTANVLAQELRLTSDPYHLVKMIEAGRSRLISVGRAFKTDRQWQRYFLLMAGIGLDASIVHGVDLNWKRHAGIGAYIASGLGFLAKMPLSPFSIDLNGQTFESTFAVVANAAHYAVGFSLAPGARVDDDKLDVCSFNSRSRLAYLGYALLSLTGSHTRRSGVVYQETCCVIANSNHSTLVQLDGDLAGNLPMQFEIVPQSLKIIASSTK